MSRSLLSLGLALPCHQHPARPAAGASVLMTSRVGNPCHSSKISGVRFEFSSLISLQRFTDSRSMPAARALLGSVMHAS